MCALARRQGACADFHRARPAKRRASTQGQVVRSPVCLYAPRPASSAAWVEPRYRQPAGLTVVVDRHRALLLRCLVANGRSSGADPAIASVGFQHVGGPKRRRARVCPCQGGDAGSLPALAGDPKREVTGTGAEDNSSLGLRTSPAITLLLPVRCAISWTFRPLG